VTDYQDVPVVILCGGRGSRMGGFVEACPKPLLNVLGRPLIWYVIAGYYALGFRKFIFPLGYLGGDLEDYVKLFIQNSPCLAQADFFFEKTGIDTPVVQRLDLVKGYLKGHEYFILTNADAISNFNFRDAVKQARAVNADAIFCPITISSPYGLIEVEDLKVTAFSRFMPVTSFNILRDGQEHIAYINSGTTILSVNTFLNHLPTLLKKTGDRFEEDFYHLLAQSGRTQVCPMSGFWKAFDTPKDIASVADGGLFDTILGIRDSFEDALILR